MKTGDGQGRCFLLWREHVCGNMFYGLSEMLHLVGLSALQKVVGRTRYYLLKCVLNAFFFFNYYGKIELNEYEEKALHLIVGDVRALSLQKTEAGSIKPGK